MNIETIIQSEVRQKEKDKYILMHIYEILKDGTDNPMCRATKETQHKDETFQLILQCSFQQEGY